jgi:hypothetical protein
MLHSRYTNQVVENLIDDPVCLLLNKRVGLLDEVLDNRDFSNQEVADKRVTLGSDLVTCGVEV